MKNGNPKLVDFLKKIISHEGAMPFDEFMGHCLYHPEWGYYSGGEERTGREGDFYTSVSVGDVFGRLMTMQFAEMWEHLGKPRTFSIVEQGANNGHFACDVLEALFTKYPDLASHTTYHIIEPHPRVAERQRTTLGKFLERVIWHPSLESIPDGAFEGIFFSNELVDSFPVKRVIYHHGEWKESLVGWDEKTESFFWFERLIPSSFLNNLANFPHVEDYVSEVCLMGNFWMEQVARILSRGYVVTVDYGYPADIHHHPERKDGTLLCYRQHQQSDNPLEFVGMQDITTHVDFTALETAGKRAGLENLGLVDQHRFLVGVVKNSLLEAEREGRMPDFDLRKFKTLMHPEILGSTFQFLLQSKEVDTSLPLSGLTHA